jgi:hypothetical protein
VLDLTEDLDKRRALVAQLLEPVGGRLFRAAVRSGLASPLAALRPAAGSKRRRAKALDPAAADAHVRALLDAVRALPDAPIGGGGGGRNKGEESGSAGAMGGVWTLETAAKRLAPSLVLTPAESVLAVTKICNVLAWW